MSRYHPQWNIEPIFKAAAHWRDTALLGGNSVFGDPEIWSDENIEQMNQHYVLNLDEGKGNFITKFEHQLENASSETRKLAAEMMWLMLLCSSNIGAKNKRDTFFTIWDWSGAELPALEPWLTDDVLRGVGSTGTAFNTHRWREVVFFVKFLQQFRSEDKARQGKLIKDPWEFAEWFEIVPDAEHRQLRHIILYLLFPDNFERIFGRTDRIKLLRAFTDLSRAQIVSMTAIEVNQEIQRIRKEWEEKHPDQKLDFYIPPLRNLWRSEQVVDVPTESDDPFEQYTSDVKREHVLQALAEIERDGIPDRARSSTYDLIHGENRYPPKYVLSLACRYATGEEFPRQFFDGGRESKAFKLLEGLGFHIELKTFISELITKFVEQADEGVNLVRSEYPKEYRGLEVRVS
ncbi:MAG: DUF3578 domain-containing protein, partial [Rhodothermales bacterium]|nr:DUF3578 domain-containing protein [Rhodothermales bacterium]